MGALCQSSRRSGRLRYLSDSGRLDMQVRPPLPQLTTARCMVNGEQGLCTGTCAHMSFHRAGHADRFFYRPRQGHARPETSTPGEDEDSGIGG